MPHTGQFILKHEGKLKMIIDMEGTLGVLHFLKELFKVFFLRAEKVSGSKKSEVEKCHTGQRQRQISRVGCRPCGELVSWCIGGAGHPSSTACLLPVEQLGGQGREKAGGSVWEDGI